MNHHRKAADASSNWRTPSSSPEIRSNPSAFSKTRQSIEIQRPPSSSTLTREKRSDPRENDSEALEAIEQGRRLYVGNLPYMAKEQDIQNLFDVEGYTVQRIDISIDPFTGRNLSYCFVDHTTQDEALRAMSHLDSKPFLGRPLKVGPGVAKRKQNQHLAAEHWKGVANQGRRLYVSGLPSMNHRTSNDLLADLFHGFKIEAISKVLSPTVHRPGSHPNHFYAFIDFSDAGEASRAAHKFNGASAFGGTLRVSRASNNSRKVDERARWDDREMEEVEEVQPVSPSSQETLPRAAERAWWDNRELEEVEVQPTCPGSHES